MSLNIPSFDFAPIQRVLCLTVVVVVVVPVLIFVVINYLLHVLLSMKLLTKENVYVQGGIKEKLKN